MAEIDFENVFPVLCKMVVLVLHCFSFLKTELPSPRDSRKPPRLVAFPSSSSAPLIRVLLCAIILARIAASFSLSNLSDKSLKLLLFMESWAFWGAFNFSASLCSICCWEAYKKNEISMRFLMPQLDLSCCIRKKSKIAINELFSLLMGVNQNPQNMWLEELSFFRFKLFFVQKNVHFESILSIWFSIRKSKYLTIKFKKIAYLSV